MRPYYYLKSRGPEQAVVPIEEFQDPVNRQRVSQPQSLIDTDFEYGLQPTKWELLPLTNNRPSAFYDPTAPVLNVTNLSGTGSTRVVTVLTSTPPSVGTPVFIQGANDQNANGWYLVETVSAGTNFTYSAKANVANGSQFDSNRTLLFAGSFYSGAAIQVATGAGAAFTNSGTTVTATTVAQHGLHVGDLIYVVGSTAATSNPPNGSWVVASVPTANSFTFVVVTAPVGAITATGGANATIYGRSGGYSIHRAFDGGVAFSAGSGSPNSQLVRQTRRYFRYQSGKGIEFSTGTIFAPALSVDSLTSSGTTVTVTTRFPHGLTINATVRVDSAIEAAYNGTFPVASVPSDTTFTYIAASVPTRATATGFPINVTPTSWYGCTTRIGLFDSQNGAFFEFDGQTLFCVRRSSTAQLSGLVAVTNGSSAVTGTNTRFVDQLTVGGYIVIRGMSYRVLQIQSQTALVIAPEYRGVTSSNTIVSRTIDTRIAQVDWNIDRFDGNGISKTAIDIGKMQMLYIDYSWYGAGFIRWGMRGANGNKTYVHKLQNNNVNTEAYMRSGNLPARYDSMAIGPLTTLTSSVAATDGTINVVSTAAFPSAGTIRISDNGTSGNIELITYTNKSPTAFLGCTRGVTGGQTASAFSFSATSQIAVEYAVSQSAPAISHWGSSVIMDGRYDADSSLIFNQGMSSALTIAAGATNALMSIRLGPSVDSGLTGLLGARELLNRMQLKLSQLDAIASGTLRLALVLNGRVSAGNFQAVGGSSLSQICFHAAATTIAGGEAAFSCFTNTNAVTQQDLDKVRDLGTSILGGGTALAVPTTPANLYPDGPDVVTLVAINNTGGSLTVQARLSWTEAQA